MVSYIIANKIVFQSEVCQMWTVRLVSDVDSRPIEFRSYLKDIFNIAQILFFFIPGEVYVSYLFKIQHFCLIFNVKIDNLILLSVEQLYSYSY